MAYYTITGNKKLTITIKEIHNSILISIEDNGVGRKRSQELNQIKNKNHNSFATTANQKRLEIINKDRTNKITVNIIDQFDNTGIPLGSIVNINLPSN